MKKTGLLHYLGLLLVAAVFVAAAWLLHRQWHDNHLTLAKVGEDLGDYLHRPGLLLAAVGLTVVNYVVLVFFDYLAFRFAKVPISRARIAFAAIITYAFSYNFGATVAGIPLRYRLYSSWNIPLTKIVQLLVILAFTFWFGVFALSGALFVVTPLRIPHEKLRGICDDMTVKFGLTEKSVHAFRFLFADSTVFGLVLLGMAAAYVATSLVGTYFLHRGSLKIFRWTLPVPPPRLTLYQIGIASADMLVAAAVFYVLCPHVRHGYWSVLEVYLVAYVLNVISHVPGGWGVIEAVITGLLSALDLVAPSDMPKIFAAIVVFRVIYFLMPLLVAALLLAWHEFALRQNWITPLPPHDEDAASAEVHGASTNGQPGKELGKSSAEK
jgi:uncharacterized membrane protein YbhN (UPF0104 family)